MVKKKCVNGQKQEFYGFDDECLLFTTNTNIPNQYGRPFALGRGAVDLSQLRSFSETGTQKTESILRDSSSRT